MTDQVRSILSAPVQRFWNEWTKATEKEHQPIVFGALDLKTSNRGDMVGVRNWSSLNRHVESVDVAHAFERISMTCVDAFNETRMAALCVAGADEWAVFFAMIEDLPGLRDLVGGARQAEMDAQFPQRRRVDGGLREVRRHVRRAAPVGAATLTELLSAVFVRPDWVYSALLLREGGLGFFARLLGLEGIATLSNDVAAAMPQSHI